MMAPFSSSAKVVGWPKGGILLLVAYSLPAGSQTTAISRPYWKPELMVPFWQSPAFTNGTHFILFGIFAIMLTAAREVDCGATGATRSALQANAEASTTRLRRTAMATTI